MPYGLDSIVERLTVYDKLVHGGYRIVSKT